MKRPILIILIGLLLALGIGLYLFISCYRLTPPAVPADWLTYTNREAGFTLRFPKGTKVCYPMGEGTECRATKTNISDKDLAVFHLEPAETVYLDINYLKNALGMSAVDYAKRSVRWIKADKTSNAVISQEQETTFAGQPAYSFVTANVFEQRGGAYDNNGDFIDDPAFYDKPGEGYLIARPHKIIYFDHGGYLFRVWYPADDAAGEAIVNSLAFIKP